MAGPEANAADLVRALTDALKQNAKGQEEAMKSAMDLMANKLQPLRLNPDYVPVGPTQPAGVTKHPLTRRTFFKGVEQDEEVLTPEEIDLFNQLKSGDYRLEIQGVPRVFTVRERENGSNTEVRVDFPLSVEERGYGLPALSTLLRAIISGVPALA